VQIDEGLDRRREAVVVLRRDEHEGVGIGDAAENRLHRRGRINADAGVQIEIGEIDDIEVDAFGACDRLEEPTRHDAAKTALAVAADDHGQPERI
jgi:hypothetical protein